MASASWQYALAYLSLRVFSVCLLVVGLFIFILRLYCSLKVKAWLNTSRVHIKRDKLDVQVQATIAKFPTIDLHLAQRRYNDHVVNAIHNFNVIREKELRRFQGRFPRATAPPWLASSLPTPSFIHPSLAIDGGSQEQVVEHSIPSTPWNQQANQPATFQPPPGLAIQPTSFQPLPDPATEMTSVQVLNLPDIRPPPDGQTTADTNRPHLHAPPTEPLEASQCSSGTSHAHGSLIAESNPATSITLLSHDGQRSYTVTTSHSTAQVKELQLRALTDLPIKRAVSLTSPYDFFFKTPDRLERPAHGHTVPPRWLAVQLQARGESDGTLCTLCASHQERPFEDCVRVSGICGNCVWLERISSCGTSARDTLETGDTHRADIQVATLPSSNQQRYPSLARSPHDRETKEFNDAPDADGQDAASLPQDNGADVTPAAIITLPQGTIPVHRMTQGDLRRTSRSIRWVNDAPIVRALEPRSFAGNLLSRMQDVLANPRSGHPKLFGWICVMLQMTGEAQDHMCDACRTASNNPFPYCVKYPSGVGLPAQCANCKLTKRTCGTTSDVIDREPKSTKRKHPESLGEESDDGLPPSKVTRRKRDSEESGASDSEDHGARQRVCLPGSPVVAGSRPGRHDRNLKRLRHPDENDSVPDSKRQKLACSHESPGHCFLAQVRHFYSTSREFRQLCRFMDEATKSNNICVFMNVLLNPTSPVTRSIQRIKQKHQLNNGPTSFRLEIQCGSDADAHDGTGHHFPPSYLQETFCPTWSEVAFWLQLQQQEGTAKATALFNDWVTHPMPLLRACSQRYCSNPSHLRVGGHKSPNTLPNNTIKTEPQIVIETFAALNRIDDIFDASQWREGMYHQNELEIGEKLADQLTSKDFEIASYQAGSPKKMLTIKHLAEALVKADLVEAESKIDGQFDTFVELYQREIPFWLPRPENYSPPAETP